MKKVLFVIPITILIVLLSRSYSVYADSDHYAIYVTQFSSNMYEFKVYNCWSGSSLTVYSDTQYKLYGCSLYADNNGTFYEDQDSAVLAAYQYIRNLGNAQGVTSSSYLNRNGSLIITNGINNDVEDENVYSSFDDYINPPTPEPTWFEIWSNNVQQFLEDWLPWAVDLDHAFDDLTMWLFGMELDGDDVQYGNDIEFYDFPSPTPFPTQIPYQEQVVPDGNGGFTIQYIYNNPSGNPITATAPPPEPTYSIQITDTPQYDISGVPVPPADGLQDAIDAIDDNIDDYQEGFEAVQGSFSTLPIKWYFFFGVPAAILLIAGIIRSLLGG